MKSRNQPNIQIVGIQEDKNAKSKKLLASLLSLIESKIGKLPYDDIVAICYSASNPNTYVLGLQIIKPKNSCFIEINFEEWEVSSKDIDPIIIEIINRELKSLTSN